MAKIEPEKIIARVETRKEWVTEYQGQFWDGFRYALDIMKDLIKTEESMAKEREDFELIMANMAGELDRCQHEVKEK